MSQTAHTPVLPREVIHWLDPQSGETVVDGTLGGGGHAQLLAEKVGASGRVIGLDRDPAAVESTRQRISHPVEGIVANYAHLRQILDDLNVDRVDRILLDLGLSSDQLADAERGFSFQGDGPLDLRFNPDEGEPAWRLIERLSEKQLADILFRFGQERYSRRIARRIAERRRAAPIRTAGDLAELVRSSIGGRFPHRRGSSRRPLRIHPATRTFQALRIAVNDEIANLETALDAFPSCLREDGRLVVISFHSLEDRVVKHAFRENSAYQPLTPKPIRPQPDELAENRRCRSSRLRAARRTSIS